MKAGLLTILHFSDNLQDVLVNGQDLLDIARIFWTFCNFLPAN
ncbi:hypothetical protein [Haliscomenobacter hydrossis]|nr:hypothetical protein [Haliscomenobacter hydrossis]